MWLLRHNPDPPVNCNWALRIFFFLLTQKTIKTCPFIHSLENVVCALNNFLLVVGPHLVILAARSFVKKASFPWCWQPSGRFLDFWWVELYVFHFHCNSTQPEITQRSNNLMWCFLIWSILTSQNVHVSLFCKLTAERWFTLRATKVAIVNEPYKHVLWRSTYEAPGQKAVEAAKFWRSHEKVNIPSQTAVKAPAGWRATQAAHSRIMYSILRPPDFLANI